MIRRIKDAILELIQGVPWMEETTKKVAQEKVGAFLHVIVLLLYLAQLLIVHMCSSRVIASCRFAPHSKMSHLKMSIHSHFLLV